MSLEDTFETHTTMACSGLDALNLYCIGSYWRSGNYGAQTWSSLSDSVSGERTKEKKEKCGHTSQHRRLRQSSQKLCKDPTCLTPKKCSEQRADSRHHQSCLLETHRVKVKACQQLLGERVKGYQLNNKAKHRDRRAEEQRSNEQRNGDRSSLAHYSLSILPVWVLA